MNSGLEFDAVALDFEDGTPVDGDSVDGDSLESSVSESGCTGCQNAQDISLWLALIVLPLKRRFYDLSQARISRS